MQKINKLNQYLLEKYPTVWNTKIVWMLLTSVLVHILFFIIGYLSHIDPVSLQKSNVTDDYFTNGVIFVHLIISILMLVGWLIMMFRNNAFKNFYPSSKRKLFLQFLQYFVIILSCTTFYFSYMTGFKIFINNKYPDTEMKANIEIINRSKAFLTQNPELYTLDNRLSPKPFYDLYCETDIKKVDRDKKYIVFYNRVYQYYSLYSKTSYKKDDRDQFILPEPEGTSQKEVVYSTKNANSETFFFKKEVVDISHLIKSVGFSYYNFSEVFYEYNSNNTYRNPEVAGDVNHIDKQNLSLQKRKSEINRKTIELLEKNNPAEIEKLLSQFLNISNQFKIRNNLQAKEWTKMVYAPTAFEVRYFIRNYKPVKGEEYDPNNSDYYSEGALDAVAVAVDSSAAVDAAIVNEDGVIVDDSIRIREFNPEINNQISPENYVKNNITDYYFYTDNLKDFLASVDEVKNEDFFSENIHIYIWIAFFLSTFILSFRITGLKSLLFSIIAAGVLVLSFTLVTFLYALSMPGREEYFISHFALILSLVILAIPLLMMNKFNKMVTSIFVNISLNGFVLFVLLIFAIIAIYQKDACHGTSYSITTGEEYEDCQTIFEYLGFNMSYLILIVGFLFVYFYASILQKWKARPE